MAVLTIRNLPDEVRDRVRRHYGANLPRNVVDDFIAERRREVKRE